MRRPTPLLFAVLAVGALALTACGDPFVDPFLRSGGPYSVYGALRAETFPTLQRVRVQPVRTLPDAPTDPGEPTARLAVDVWTEDLSTGDTLRWNRRDVRFDDGTVGTVFERRFRALPGRTYRVRLRDREREREARVDVDVPEAPTGQASPATILDGAVTQQVAWSADRLLGANVVYRLGATGQGAIALPYPPPPAGEPLVIDYTADAERLREILTARGTPPSPAPLVLTEVLANAFAPGSSWPEIPTDPTVAAQPGAYSNVDGGYGFVGGLTYGYAVVTPGSGPLLAAGFRLVP